ncbi:class I SAM-dependent methyltransferase [Actinoplanes sp. TBRC 11911]|uniref:class I SAM-dependent methyltransferase n=1 Tax=Actinoplanes sp. TBRC 11911 TaxID=2729386 RepID=UPI00145F260E|nr:SAM-dependent methyltransferase [Actinoplanes sp. TBRC 11911]NMO54935.1 class I SAM-dependent methyltransferase [Actinoplanes sp. TBRC 11911]
MNHGQPSRTAFSAARYRAAHQLLEQGKIFTDPLAVRILGVPESELLADAPRRAMRVFIAARTRFAEDAPARSGLPTLVVLGAGLDTFAYRNPFPGVRVIEVDHPDTQAWKRQRLAATGIAIPPDVTYLGVDFERETLGDRLAMDGPAFFLWLGVVPYLTRQGFDETLKVVASRAGNEVVFDYAQSPERMSPERRAALEARASRVARIGEPWLTYFEPDEIAAELAGLGFGTIDDLGPSRLAARFFGREDVPPDTPGGHVLHAIVGPA